MSWCIDIPCASPPPIAELLQAIDVVDLRCAGGNEAVDAWPAKPVQLYRHLVSCRATELECRDEVIRVTVRAMPAAEDCALAVTIATRVAALVGASLVMPEMFEPMAAQALEQLVDADFIRGSQESDARMIRAMIQREGILSAPGAIRPWHVGPRTLAELESKAGERPLHELMIDRMRQVQWIDESEGYNAARQFVTSEADPSKRITVAVWQPALKSLLPEAKHVVVDDGKSIIILPHAKFVEVAGNRLKWLDECQTLVEAVRDVDISALFALARPHDIKEALRSARQAVAASAPRSPVRKWWQFWK